MTNRELVRRLHQLRALSKKAGEASLSDLELLAHWAKYLCVLVAGFLETALEENYSDYVETAASPPVAAFAVSMLGRIQNPKANHFLEIAGYFKESWKIELEAHLDQNGRRDAIDSVMANRHLIAHGEHSGITLARVNAYLEKCVEVVDFIEAQCGVAKTS
jgi:hypothetical protein